MTSCQRFQAIMNFQPFDRQPIIERAGWWGETLNRWYSEGLPATLKDHCGICRYFGLDVGWQAWRPAAKPA